MHQALCSCILAAQIMVAEDSGFELNQQDFSDRLAPIGFPPEPKLVEPQPEKQVPPRKKYPSGRKDKESERYKKQTR